MLEFVDGSLIVGILAGGFAVGGWAVSRYYSNKHKNSDQDRRIEALEEWRKEHEQQSDSWRNDLDKRIDILVSEIHEFRLSIAQYHAEQSERLVRLETILLNGNYRK